MTTGLRGPAGDESSRLGAPITHYACSYRACRPHPPGWLTHVLWLIPTTLWSIHIFYLLPVLSNEKGDSILITFVWFACPAAGLMIAAEIAAIVVAVYYRRLPVPLIIAIVLNLTPLYYLKVLLWGPTVGML